MLQKILEYARAAAVIAIALVAFAVVIAVVFISAGTAGAAPIGTSYDLKHTGKFYVTDHSFESFVIHRDTDGTLSVSGEKLGGESAAVSIQVSLDGEPFELAQTQDGRSAVRMDPDFGVWTPGSSKTTLRRGDNVRFELRYTPPAWATDVTYNVTISGAEQEEGNWLVSFHEPKVDTAEL